MNTRMLKLAGVLAALAALVLAASSWLGEREDRIRMAATISAQSQVIAQQKQQMQTLADEEQRRDAAAQQKLSAMQAQVAQLKTAAQIAAWLPKQVALPEPVKIELPAATKENAAPPAVAAIPQADLPALRDQVEACRECSVKLSAAQQDLASRDARLKISGEQLSAMQRERDAAVKAAKGGGFWTRMKRSAKWFLIGAGAGAAALCASGHCK